jgi:signal transduction histidine kinase
MKFAILDDSHRFLKALEAEWAIIGVDYPDLEGQFVVLTAERDFSTQIAPLADCRHLLLDVSYLDDTKMQALAVTLPNTLFWMMTGKANAEEVEGWLNWTKAYPPHAQAEWFEKPLSLENTVLPVWRAATPSDSPDLARDGLLTELNTFPIPCRWFNAAGAAIHNNDLWRIALYANPNRFSLEETGQLKRGETVALDTWSERPDHPGIFGKVRYISRTWRDGYLQFGLSLPEARDDTVRQAVSDIFAFMIGSGSFTRARYYEILRVPGSDGVLCLRQASHPLDVEIPVAQPMGPTLAERVRQYDAELAIRHAKKARKGELIHFIREHKRDQTSTDTDIRYWREHAQTGSVPWLTLPICKKNQAVVSSLLIFDRLGKPNGADDYDGEAISPALVKNLAPKLLGGIQHLREALEQEDVKKRLERREAMAEWRNKFASQVEGHPNGQQNACLTNLERLFLDAAKALTQADSALLALRPPAANYLESRTQPDHLMGGLRLNYDRTHFIAVQCARGGQPVYLPDFLRAMGADSAITENDWRDALAHRTRAEQDERLPKLLVWQYQQLGSVVALPVKYDDSLIGVLVLHHKDRHFFTEVRVKMAETLIREAHPFLRRARALTARDAWDSMIFHEVRSGLNHIRAQVDWVLNPSPSKLLEEAAKAILARTELMTDLSNEVLAMLGYPDKQAEPREYSRDNPLALLNALWSELVQLPEARGMTLDAAGGSLLHPLHDPNNALPHVLRVVLDNALRYGKPGLIMVSQESENGHWRLCLCNPGQFSDALLQGQFAGLSEREDLAQDSLRAHIGLASCQRVLEGLSGRIELKNRPAQDTGQLHACVTLIWPYARTEAANRGGHPSKPSQENRHEPPPQGPPRQQAHPADG